jgi:hypothetical protein
MTTTPISIAQAKARTAEQVAATLAAALIRSRDLRSAESAVEVYQEVLELLAPRGSEDTST